MSTPRLSSSPPAFISEPPEGMFPVESPAPVETPSPNGSQPPAETKRKRNVKPRPEPMDFDSAVLWLSEVDWEDVFAILHDLLPEDKRAEFEALLAAKLAK